MFIEVHQNHRCKKKKIKYLENLENLCIYFFLINHNICTRQTIYCHWNAGFFLSGHIFIDKKKQKLTFNFGL